MITPSTRTSNRSSIPATLSTCTVLALAETIAVWMPFSLTAWIYVIVPSYTWTPPAAILARTRSFLRLLSPYRVGVPGASSGVPSGRWIPRDSRNALVPSSLGLPST